jgi:hypothetical protein
MKTFQCSKCGTYLGEMSKGKIRKGVVFLCFECVEKTGKHASDRTIENDFMKVAGDLFGGIFNK